ncbi:terminase small subunit [Limosilactobacillus fermentum]|nr:terminase small subunit [Limosilactobacillus fermentum]PHI34003.1 terminase small subunit [Limosilactobacillus fermentum]
MAFYFGKGASSITKKLTLKQQRFVDEYIISGNATQAAIKAGYSKRSAYSVGQENLRKPVIKAAIDKRNAEIESEKTADMTEVMEYLTYVMRGEQTESVATAKGIYDNVPVSAKDRIKAAELIGKRHGAWTDKKEISGNMNIDIGMGDYDEDN